MPVPRDAMIRRLKRKFCLAGLLFLVSPAALLAEDVITGEDIPELLGVWYGSYQAPDVPLTEIWLEISFQKPVNGYEVRGFNRWHVLNNPDARNLGPESRGFGAEHFDTVAGRISDDGRSVRLVEDHSKATAVGTMVGTERMSVEVTLANEQEPAYKFVLDRVDTHYSPSDQTLLGIDVSHHSGDVDWQVVRDTGYAFAYLKASEGVDNPDARFEEHWATLREMNFPRGAYHFYVTEDDPEEQAKFFASRLREDPGTLPPVIDVELLGHGTEGDMTATLLRFLEVFEAETGCEPIIYTGPVFWDKYYRPEFSRYRLWLAEVGVIMPKVPFGWKTWTLWQRKINQLTDGVEKDADISILHPSIKLEDLEMTGKGGCSYENSRPPGTD